MNKRRQSGFAAFEILIMVFAIVLLGGIIWYSYQARANKDAAQDLPLTTQTPQSQTSPSASPSPANVATVGSLAVPLPTGWSKADKSRTIGGIQYKVALQLEPNDFLKAPGYSSATLYKTIKTRKGTPAYLLKPHGTYLVLSSCAPAAGYGCSFRVDGKYFFMLLHTYKPGDQAVGELDFTKSETTTAISDFTKMVESLDL